MKKWFVAFVVAFAVVIAAVVVSGMIVAQDKKESVKLYRQAAEQGVAEAQYKLGYCYAEGEGVEQDKKEAVKWFRKAAE